MTVFSLLLRLNIWNILKCGSCSLFMKSKQSVRRPCSSIMVFQLKANVNKHRIAHNSLQGKHPNLQCRQFKTNGNISSNNCSTKYAYPQQQIPKPTIRNPPWAVLYFIISKQRCCSFESNPELLTLLLSKSSETGILITLSVMLRLSFSCRLKCQLLALKKKVFFP